MTQNRADRALDARPNAWMARKRIGILLGSLFVVALCMAIRYYWGAEPANADPTGTQPAARSSPAEARQRGNRPASAEKPASSADENASGPPVPPVVATVNTQKISREDLQGECLRHYGTEVLESMVNRHLIVQECRRQGIRVTRADVDAEIERMAKQFGIPVDQWLKMLKQERNITAAQYANDIIWPTLALRKLAGGKLTVTREELAKEFETQYGEAIRARLIAVSDPQRANDLHAKATAKPEDFGNLAKDCSEDAPSASVKGIIQPIRKHGSYKEIEDAVFNMADGEISPVIHAGGQYVILKREGSMPARQVKFEQVASQLDGVIRDRKTRSVAQDVFHQLQKGAKIENVWNDPARRAQMPGVAALINGDQITLRELAEECVARHGQETLEGMISRKILELACQRQGIAVTEKDIDQEIARAAATGVKSKPDGSPDVAAWLELVTKKQGVPLEVYRNDAVWPSVALKKLVGKKVEVTEEDIRRGYEANYGARVRCLAIVLNDQRHAQQVFEMARRDNTAKHFGELATQYSVEPGSKALAGEVPPIKKYGGQPILEEEAFKLKPGELSGIIQVGDKFIILRCEGYTKLLNVEFAQVRNDIYEDLLEKKLRLAMAECFEKLQESATIDNYLAGTSQSPKKPGEASPSTKLPKLRQVSAE